jgi:hypothetical protein
MNTKKIEKQVRENMTTLGTYKPEFDTIIGIYADLISQYQYMENDCPNAAFIATLRKEILTFSNALGLTPSGLKKLNDEANKPKKPLSKLEMALKQFG